MRLLRGGVVRESTRKGRTHREGPAISPPEQPCWRRQNHQPEQQSRTGFGEKHNECEEVLESAAKTIDDCVAQLHCNRGRWRGEPRLILFGKFQIDRGEVDAMPQSLLRGLHLPDFAAYALDFLIHVQYIYHLSGWRTKYD